MGPDIVSAWASSPVGAPRGYRLLPSGAPLNPARGTARVHCPLGCRSPKLPRRRVGFFLLAAAPVVGCTAWAPVDPTTPSLKAVAIRQQSATALARFQSGLISATTA